MIFPKVIILSLISLLKNKKGVFRNITYLVLINLPLLTFAQEEYTITGNVLSETGIPVPNVSVSIEGVYTDPAITDSTGSFSLMVPGGDSWILVSPISDYKSKKIYLNRRNNLTIFLVPDNLSSGYDRINNLLGDELKRNLKSSYVSLNISDIYDQPVQTIDQIFQGRVAGLWGTNHSGMPGEGTYSIMRGVRSMYTNLQPRYIVDGMIYENPGTFISMIEGSHYHPLASLDPRDIVSVSVIRDASAAALYGTKASNGVILIETLKPTETRTTIEVSLRTGFSQQPKQIPVLEREQYRSLANELLISSNFKEETFYQMFPGLYDDPYSEDYKRYIHNTNWQDKVFQNSILNDIYMRVRGGDEIGKYGLSVGYGNYGGIIKKTDYSRFNIRFVGTLNVFERVRMFVSANLNYSKSNLKETGLSVSASPILTSLFKTPLMAVHEYDEEGNELTYLDEVDAFGISNPVATIEGFNAKNNSYRFIGSFRFEGDITSYLKWNSLLGLNINTMKESVFSPDEGMVEYYDDEAYNLSKQKTDYLNSLYLDNYFAFRKSFSGVHEINSAAGFRLNTNHYEEDFGIGKNTPSDEYTSLRYGTSSLSEITGDIGNWNWMAFYGNAEYSFRDKYFLGSNISLDGNSRTGKDANTGLRMFNVPFGVFPSLSAAWRITGEHFLNNVAWIEDLRIRISYGLIGNDDIGNYSSKTYYQQVLYRETSGLVLGTKPNTELKFETNAMFNAGIDFALAGERLNLSLDYFNVKTSDLFIYERQLSYMGFQYRPVNGGEIRNKGYELSLSLRLLHSGRFIWDMGLNLAQYNNNIISIKGGEVITDFEGGQIISKPGSPVNSFYGYIADGVFSDYQEALAAGLVNERGIAFGAGDMKYLDLSGPKGIPDKVINGYDKTIIGNPNPDLFGGTFTNLIFGKWSMRVLMQFVKGNDIFNYLRYQTEKMEDLSNQSTSVLRRWQYDGHVTDIPHSSWGDPVGNNDFSTRWIEDGSYLRIKNVSLSYTIPEKFLLFQNVRFFVSGYNLITFSRYLGYDPEFHYSNDPLMQGIDYGQIPQCRTYMAGIRFGL